MKITQTIDKKYKKMLRHIIDNGEVKEDRTGTGTVSIFDYTIKHNMEEGFPLLTSKTMYYKGIIKELLWFLNGDTNIQYLVKNNVNIWNGDAYKHYKKDINNKLSLEEFVNKISNDDEFAKIHGELGPVYGKQWTNWNDSVNQIQNIINLLKTNPDSRRMIVNAWNAEDVSKVVLPPCHYTFQFYTNKLTLEERLKLSNIKEEHIDDNIETKLDSLKVPKRALSLKFIMRSNDTFLGFPFNIASYAFLLKMIAQQVNMTCRNVIYSGGDVHLYNNHLDVAEKYIKQPEFELCSLELNKAKDIFSYKLEDFKINDYKSAGIMKASLSN